IPTPLSSTTARLHRSSRYHSPGYGDTILHARNAATMRDAWSRASFLTITSTSFGVLQPRSSNSFLTCLVHSQNNIRKPQRHRPLGPYRTRAVVNVWPLLLPGDLSALGRPRIRLLALRRET